MVTGPWKSQTCTRSTRADPALDCPHRQYPRNEDHHQEFQASIQPRAVNCEVSRDRIEAQSKLPGHPTDQLFTLMNCLQRITTEPPQLKFELMPISIEPSAAFDNVAGHRIASTFLENHTCL